MSSSRSRQLNNSLGNSWGDADYESDSGASIHTPSELESDIVSDSDLEGSSDDERQTKGLDTDRDLFATPRPSKTSEYSSTLKEETPVERQAATPTNRSASRNSSTLRTAIRAQPVPQPKASQTLSGTSLAGPSFIMPSMASSRGVSHSGSPGMRKSQVRARRPRTSEQPTESQPTKHSQRLPRIHEAPPPDPAWDPRDYLEWLRANILWPVLRYALNVGGLAMEYLKPIFGLGLTIWLLTTLLISAQGFMQSALSPICHIPLSSYVLPFCANFKYSDNTTNFDPEFEHFMEVQSTIEEIVKKNQDASLLPHTMKDSEHAVRDLRTVVKYSKLPSKHQFEVEFDGFIATAKEASHDLIRYNQKIGAAVAKIIHTNQWTMNTLQGYASAEASRGKLAQLADSLNPLSVFMAPEPTLQQKVFDQYIAHIGANKDEISALIDRGVALLAILNNLEDRLDLISEMAVRDELIVDKNRDELLSQLWTKLGGNKASRKELERHLGILKQVNRNNKNAITLVASTVIRLQEISAGLEDLKDTVAAPEAVGYREDIPLNRYIELVERATERLQIVRGDVAKAERSQYLSALGKQEAPGALPGRKNDEEPPVVFAKVKGGTSK